MERPTIYDVATLARVSKSTVSRVLRGDSRVSPAKRAAVDDAINALHYVPTAAAQNLRSSAEKSIGLLIRNIDTASYAILNAQLQTRLRAEGFHVVQEAIVGMHPVKERDLLANLISLKVRGVIVASGTFPSEILNRYAQIVPLVVAGRPEPDESLNNVAYDHAFNGRLIADHLYQLGHRNILVETMPLEFSVGTYVHSHATIQRAEELGMTAHSYDVSGIVNYQTVINQVASGTGPTAVACAYDRFAFQLWRELTSRGIRVPDDVSIIGSDGLAEGMDLLGLTTVRLPVEKVAQATTELIMHLVEQSENAQQPTRLLIPGWLLKGRTAQAI